MIPIKKLSISIHDAEFAKDYQYSISVLFQGEKYTTDISAIASNPIFTNNTFVFNLPTNNTIRSNVIFTANMIAEEQQPTHSKSQFKSKPKILGQCVLDLTPFGLQPTQTYNLPIRQQIKFIRNRQGKQINIGRCIVSVKIVAEEQIPLYLQQLEDQKIDRKDVYNQLPDYDEHMDFLWRVKVEARHAFNVQTTSGINPQVCVETGWTQYQNTLPESNRIFSTNILNKTHPEWNQTFLISNPSHVNKVKGFIMVLMKDNNNIEDIIRIFVPLESMGIFTPYNLKIIKTTQTAPTQLYISLTLQSSTSTRQKLYDIIISDILFQPLVTNFKEMNLIMSTTSDTEPILQFYPFNPEQDSIERILQFDQANQFNYYMSQTMKVPPIKSTKQFRAATIMTIPQTFLKKQLTFHLATRVQKKYKLLGNTFQFQKDLAMLLIQKIKKQLFLSVRPTGNSKIGKCQIEISDKQSIQVIKSSRVSSRSGGQQKPSQKLMKELNISSNDSFFKHLSQNNEIITKLLRQLDDKSQSLKQAASQISDLRGKIKLLQNQNSILRRKTMTDEDQLVNMVQRQIQTMSQRDLKDKIIKISQLYKTERTRTKQLDKALKIMEPQVSNSMQLNSIISSQKNTIQTLEDKIQKINKDMERIHIYKETIKKQQKVIQKLQKVMKDGMQQVRKAKDTRIQLEQFKKRSGSYGNTVTTNLQARDQIQRLQKIISQLQQSNRMGLSNISDNQNNNTYELQFKLHQAQTRIQYLQEQIQQKSKSYARQLAMMKMKIAQKQAILDGYSK